MNILQERLQIALPIIQAPMAGGATTPQLVAAISNAGGLGSLAAGYLPPAAIREAIHQVRQLTNKPFAVNLFVPNNAQATKMRLQRAWECVQHNCSELNISLPRLQEPYVPDFAEQMEVVLQANVPVFSFTFGIPEREWREKLAQQNIVTIGTATSLVEAKLLEQHDIDIICAQGKEAGGHRGTFLTPAEDALLSASDLISRITGHCKTPVIAAGGIMRREDLRAALQLRACGVQIGTAFLCCEESGIHPAYKNILLESKQDKTVLTNVFSGKLARGVNNKFIQLMQHQQHMILPYPLQHALTVPMRKAALEQSNIDYMSLWAGQGMPHCQTGSAAEILRHFIN